MSKENTLLLLWIIFGFTFVAALDSILYFFIYLVYFGMSELGLSLTFLTYFIPTITILSYFFTILFLFKKIKTNSNSEGIYLISFPKKTFILFLILVLLLKPIASKLSGLYAEYYIPIQDVAASDYLGFYGLMHATFAVSRWGAIIIIAFIYLKKYQSLKLKSK
ncbi:hypothetical protein [uncultured Marixanthomonas sp.]|uniref:hypothetical protein n=1 Tax=uncultured Marixanthomonas sp. TaxID=757245 RepID=UPI0030DACA81|tara:strand:+ start:1211 stop:1702 length:492 start_codon:yes stop_codon:yes gene_type:complete